MRENYPIIRFGNINDIERIMKFIKDNWNENHIMANSKKMMKYQHVLDNQFTYVLAEDRITKKIYGICGYILCNKFEKPDLWIVVWKTIQSPNCMLGIDIINFIKEKTKCRIFASNGINPRTVSIYKYLGYYTGNMEQYYRINDKQEYKIAVIRNKEILDYKKFKYKLKLVKSIEEIEKIFDISKYNIVKPYKEKWYIQHRYFQHPIYKYMIYAIDKDERNIQSILIGREIEQNNTKILRIVDFIGEKNDLNGIGNAIDNLINTYDYEYVDFYCYGIPEKILNNAGFIKRKENDKNIIPNHFEPFEQKNIELKFVTNDCKDFCIFKADADQDRPNII